MSSAADARNATPARLDPWRERQALAASHLIAAERLEGNSGSPLCMSIQNRQRRAAQYGPA
jgi:hypothetical protein